MGNRNAEKASGFGLTLVLLVASVAASAQTSPSAADDAAVEDYRVYDVVLDQVELPKEDLHFLILDDTLNFKCGEDSGNPILLNGCSGMIMPPATTTPEQIGQFLRQNWPRLDKTTWEDFERRNANSAKLRDSFVTPWKHLLEGQDVPEDKSKEWDSSDGAFYFSRVGFNSKRTEALVFAFFASYMKGVGSTGYYFLMRRDTGKEWKLDGRLQMFTTDKQN